MQLTQEKFSTIATFIKSNARPVDTALFSYYFENSPRQAVVDELKSYQNPDGGFGHGLEPDFTTPISSAIATTVALQYMTQIGIDHANAMLLNTISYFCNSFVEKKGRWLAVPPDVNKHPHAPWWHLDDTTGMCLIDDAWENPTVEILGYLHTFPNQFSRTKRDELTRTAILNLKENTELSEHSLYCYLRFFDHVDSTIQNKIQSALTERIQQVVNRNPEDWKTKYVPKPLDFIKTPNSPFYAELKDLVDQNLDMLIKTFHAEEAWQPTWQWGQYEDAWKKAKIEWTGKIAVENLFTLREFGRVEL